MENIEEENMKQEEGGTFSEIFRRIWKRKWIALAITVAVMLVSVLVFALIVNPIMASYTISFNIVYPGSETLKYPNGTPFYYEDIVSEGYLAKAKEQDERFENIDIEKLVEENGISVEAETETVNGVRTYTGKYTITATASYFPSRSVANDFIKTVARVPEILVKEAAEAVDFTTDETEFSKALFQSRLALLTAQKEAILAQYDLWIEQLGGSFRVDGRTLMASRAEIEVVFDTATLETLEKELQLGGYVPVAVIEDTRKLLKEEFNVNEKKIEELKKANGVSTVSYVVPLAATSGSAGTDKSDVPQIVFPEEEPDISQMLASLISRNEEIRYQLGNNLDPDAEEGALIEDNVNKFVAKLDKQFNALQGAAEKAKNVSVSLYGQQAYTRFEKANVEKTGSIGLVIIVVASFVLGVVVATIAAYVLENVSRKKAAAPAEEAAPAESAEPKDEE